MGCAEWRGRMGVARRRGDGLSLGGKGPATAACVHMHDNDRMRSCKVFVLLIVSSLICFPILSLLLLLLFSPPLCPARVWPLSQRWHAAQRRCEQPPRTQRHDDAHQPWLTNAPWCEPWLHSASI